MPSGEDRNGYGAQGRELETITTHGKAAGRGTGVLPMARAMRAGRPHRAESSRAYHVMDVMTAIDETLRNG